MSSFNLADLLAALVANKGSDLHLAAHCAPRIRVNGQLVSMQLPLLSPADVARLCGEAMSKEQRESLERRKEVDFALALPKIARFRVNVFTERGNLGAAFRALNDRIPSFEEINLPKHLKKLGSLRRGLVLFTGPTGSGKSTSLAAMIDSINEIRRDHIITIEDPIEYLHTHKNCTVHQRELGQDTLSFANALRAALRQDPDVILLGEMRDPETIQTAITTAETGHLVFSTVHTNGCIHTMNRVIDVFPAESRSLVRNQLSLNLSAVVSQALVPGRSGKRHLATEILFTTPAIRALIAEGKFAQIYSYMQSGQEKSGMHTMNQSLAELVRGGDVDPRVAVDFSPDPQEFEQLMNKVRHAV